MPEDKSKQINVDLSKWNQGKSALLENQQYHGNAASFGDSKFDDPNISNTLLDNNDYKYIRGEKQAWGDKLANGTLRLAGRAVTSGAEGILTPFVGTFYAFKDNKASSFYDNPVTNGLDAIDKSIKEEFELHDTKASAEATGLNKLLYANTLFGDIFDGIGYSLGSIGTGTAYTKLAGAIAKTAIKGGNVGRMLKEVDGLEKASDKLEYISNINKTTKLKNGIDNGAIAFIGATAESSANARSDKKEFKEKMINELSNNGEITLTKEQLTHIDDLSEQVGNTSFAFNIPTIMLDNWITFGKSVFSNKITDKKNLLSIGENLEKGADDVYRAGKKSGIDNIISKNYGKIEFSKPFIAEGTQEQIQYAITKGTNDYYTKKYYNPDSAGFYESMFNGLGEAYGTTAGWENFIIGSLSGGVFGNATKFATEGKNAFTNTDDVLTKAGIQILNSNKSVDAYKTIAQSAMTHGNILAEQEEALAKGDTFNYENLKNDAFFNHALTRLKTGREQDLFDKLDEFKSMSAEELKSNFGTELSNENKNNVVKFVQDRIEKAKEIQDTWVVINDRFTQASPANKERLTYSTIAIKDARQRKVKLEHEVNRLMSEDTAIIASPELHSLVGQTFYNLDENSREVYIDNIDQNEDILPLTRDIILEKLHDINKLIGREKDFIDEYKELLKPTVQEKLDTADSKTEEDIINSQNEGDVATEETEETHTNEFTEDKSIDTGENQSDEVAAALMGSKKQSVTNPFEDTTEVNTKKNDAELTTLDTSQQKISTKNQDIVSDSLTTTDTQFTDDSFEQNGNLMPTDDFNSVAPSSNIVMMKLAEGYTTASGNFVLKKNDVGEVIFTGSSVSMAVNDPKVAEKGSEIEFAIVTLNEKDKKEADAAIANSKSKIEYSLKIGNYFGYTSEDMLFSSPEYTTPIGVFQKGILIGYVQIPHWINDAGDSKIDPLIYVEARKRIIAERKEILNKLKSGPVKTTVLHKGGGALLTKINKDKSPKVSGNLLKEVRPQDKFKGRAIFAYVGKGDTFTVPTSNKEIQERYSSISTRTSFGKKGKLYQVVENSAGTDSLVPVYANLISADTAQKILSEIEDLGDNPTYNIVLARLNKYIYLSNKKGSNTQFSTDNGGEFRMGGEKFTLEALKNNAVRRTLFTELLQTKVHNIDIRNLNSKAYQNYLTENNVLTTNAYTLNGQYFIQPYIAYTSILPESLTATEIKSAANKTSDEAINRSVKDDFLSKAFAENKGKLDPNDFGDNTAFSTVKEVSPLDREAVKTFLNKYTPWLTLSDVTEVSKVKGMLQDAVGAYRNMVIYLFKGSSIKTAYHEAFHGVFRNMLTPEEQTEIFTEAAKIYKAPTQEDIQEQIKSFPKNSLNEEDLKKAAINSYYEEQMAEDFKLFADNFETKSSWNKIKDFFNRILQWFGIIRTTNKGHINTLFDNIMAKKYVYSKPVNIRKDISQTFPAYSRASIGTLPVHVKDERVNAITAAFIAKYGELVKAGIVPSKEDQENIFKHIFITYKDLYLKEHVKENRNTGILNTTQQILENFGSFEKEVSELFKTKFGENVSVNSEESLQSLLDNDQDPDLNFEGNTTKGFGELTTKSGITSSSKRLRLIFATIPALESNGDVKYDRFGQPIYESFEKIYYAVERNLVGLKTFDSMMEALKKASIFRPELGSVVRMFTEPTEDVSPEILKKYQNDFTSNFRKQLMQYYLVLFNKEGQDSFSYKFVNSNREGVAQEIYYSWLNNLNNSSADIITDFSGEEPVINGSKKAEELFTEFTSKRASLTADSLGKMLSKVGVIFSDNVLNKAFTEDSAKILTLANSLFKFYATSKNSTDVNSIEEVGRKALHGLVAYELAGNLNNYASSLNNVEGKAVYPIQNPSWISDVEGDIKSDNFDDWYTQTIKDPMYKHSNLLSELREDDEYREGIFKILYLNGLKSGKNDNNGAKFTKMVSEDWLLSQLTFFQNSVGNQNKTKTPTAIYTNVTPADKTLEVMWEGKTYTVSFANEKSLSVNSEIVKKFYNVILNEAGRIKQTLKDYDTLKEEELLEYYHYNGKPSDKNGTGGQFNFLNINKVENKNGEVVDLLSLVKKALLKNPDATVKEALLPLETQLKGAITKLLNESVEKTTEDALKSGLIEEIEINGKKLYKHKTLEIPSIDGKTKNAEEEHMYIKDLLARFATNSYLANIEFSTLINGDPAYYKASKNKDNSYTPTDLPKRFYQGQSMGIRINEVDVPVIKTALIDDYYTNADVESVEVLDKYAKNSLEHYSNIKGNATNVTDAQVYCSPEIYKKLISARGQWSPQLEYAHQVALGDITVPKGKSWHNTLAAIKPFTYGNIWSDKYNRMIPIQEKCSIMPLYPSFIKDNPLLQKHATKMKLEGVDMLATKSSFKAIMPQVEGITNTLGNYKSVIDIPGKIFAFQVDNPDHMVDASNSSTRQLKMLMPGSIDPDLMYGEESGASLIQDLNDLEAANINNDLEFLLQKVYTKSFNTHLQDAMTARKATNVTKKILEVGEDGNFAYPLDSINSAATENMLSSVFTKGVIKQEFKNGGSTVQASSAGFKFNSEYRNLADQQEAVEKNPALKEAQSSLKWIRAKDEHSIEYIECAMPAWTKKFFNEKNELIDAENIPDELKVLIAYRIPNEGFHSNMSIRVVKFLPAEMGNFMLLPEQVTTQFGADFDFDKTYFFGPEFYKTKSGVLKKINFLDDSNSTVTQRWENYILRTRKGSEIAKEYNINLSLVDSLDEDSLNRTKFIDDIYNILLEESGFVYSKEQFEQLPIIEQNTKEARNTKIFDTYDKVLRSINTLPYLVKPSGFEDLKKIADKIGTQLELPNYYDPSTQRFYKDLFHSIIGLKGQAANHVTGHAYMRLADLESKQELLFGYNSEGKYKKYSDLSKLKSIEGNLISEELATMMAAILDAVKSPSLLPSLGINDKSIDIWAALVHYGIGIKNASLYTAQPIMKELTQGLRSNSKQVKEDGFAYTTVTSLRTKYLLELDALLDKDPGFKEIFNNQALGYVGVSKGYSHMDPAALEKYTTYKKIDDKTHAYYLAYQLMVLNTYEKIEPISTYIKSFNKFLTVNKEVGPNIENIIDKTLLHESLVTSDVVLGFNVDRVPQLKAFYNAHTESLKYMEKHFPYSSNRYMGIKNAVAIMQYSDTNTALLSIAHDDRRIINGFIKAYIDHSKFKEFNNISSLGDRKHLFKQLPIKISQIKSLKEKDSELNEGEKLHRKALKDNAFIKQLKVTYENGIGYITLQGNRLSDIEKNQVIAAGVALWKNPVSRPLFAELIKYSYFSTGFFTGLHSFHSLIDPDILNEFGEEKSYMKVREEALIDSKNTLAEVDEDNLLDQLIRNFPKNFTDSFNQSMFTGFEKESKPETIYIIDGNVKENPKIQISISEEDGSATYQQYIRVYSSKYKGSLLYKGDGGGEYHLTSYLGKAGRLIEINSNEPITTSIIDKNNYTKETEDAYKRQVVDPFGTDKGVAPTGFDDGKRTTVVDNNSLFDVMESEQANAEDNMSEADETAGDPKDIITGPVKKSPLSFFTKPTNEDVKSNASKLDSDNEIKPCD